MASSPAPSSGAAAACSRWLALKWTATPSSSPAFPGPARRTADGKPAVVTETITARADGDDLKLTTVKTQPDGTRGRQGRVHRQAHAAPAGRSGPVEGQVRPADHAVQRHAT